MALLPHFPTPLNGYGTLDFASLNELDLVQLFALPTPQERLQWVHQWIRPHVFSIYDTQATEPTGSTYHPPTPPDQSTLAARVLQPTQLSSEQLLILAEQVYGCLELAYQHDFSLKCIHTLLDVLAWTQHHVSTSNTGFPQDYAYFRTLLLACATPQPKRWGRWSLAQLQLVHIHFLNTYFRVYHLYKYVFGLDPFQVSKPAHAFTDPGATGKVGSHVDPTDDDDDDDKDEEEEGETEPAKAAEDGKENNGGNAKLDRAAAGGSPESVPRDFEGPGGETGV